jgi:hypothetical protein
VPSREPCFSGEAGGVETRGPAVHRVAGLAPSGARAVGCFDGGAEMCAQFWVPKAQVLGGGGGLELIVVEGRVCPRPGYENRSGYPTRALKRRLSGVGLEVLGGEGGGLIAWAPMPLCI